MKAILELVRGLFVLSVMALCISLLFTAFWIYKGHVAFNPNNTFSNNVAQAFATLQTQAWVASHFWIVADVGLVVLAGVLGWLWRASLKVLRKREQDE